MISYDLLARIEGRHGARHALIRLQATNPRIEGDLRQARFFGKFRTELLAEYDVGKQRFVNVRSELLIRPFKLDVSRDEIPDPENTVQSREPASPGP